MSDFSERMKADPPRLVVLFRRGPDGSEQFEWGVVGKMPIITLIGAVIRAQARLVVEPPLWPTECDEDALVVMWDEAARDVHTYAHPNTPALPMAGMLETIKAALVGSLIASKQQLQAARTVQEAKHRIVGPNGRPLR